MKRPIPKATPEAIAQNKKEQEARGSLSTYGKLMSNFKKGPDVSAATQVGEPTLVDPKQASAPEIVTAGNSERDVRPCRLRPQRRCLEREQRLRQTEKRPHGRMLRVEALLRDLRPRAAARQPAPRQTPARRSSTSQRPRPAFRS